MHADGFLFQAFVYLAAALVAVPIAKRLGLGSVLGYLAAGIAIGPYALGLVGREGQDVLHAAEFGVVLMLFVVGLELRPSLLWRLRHALLGLGGLQVALTAAAVLGIGVAFGLAWQTALAAGLILAMSSTAIVLQSLDERGLMKTEAGQSSFAVLLFQDLAVIPIFAVLPLLATAAPAETAEHGGWLAGLPAWWRALAIAGAVGAVVAAGLWLVRPALRIVARTGLREMFTAASLFLVVGIALLMQAVGLSPALGTFLAGVVLASSEFRHELETDLEPFKGLLLGLFFLAVGASLDLSLVAARPGVVAALVVGIVAVKFAVLFGLARGFRMSLDQGVLFAFALAQGGEFAFVLLAFASRNGALVETEAAALNAAVALSMAAAPLLLVFAERAVLPRFGTREAPGRPADDVHGGDPVLIAGFGRFGHIVGRLLRANGVRTTVLDVDSDQVEVLRRLGMQVYYGDASRLDLLRAAGAERAQLFVCAVDDPEKGTAIVAQVREHFPHLTVLARAYGRDHAYELLDAGIDHVYRETLDSALRLGVDALRLLGFRGHQAWRAARTFRRHDEASVRELAGLRQDRDSYFAVARGRIADLERILGEEDRDIDASRDAAWDTDSLRREFGR